MMVLVINLFSKSDKQKNATNLYRCYIDLIDFKMFLFQVMYKSAVLLLI